MSSLAAADTRRRLRMPGGLEDDVSGDRSQAPWYLVFKDSDFTVYLAIKRVWNPGLRTDTAVADGAANGDDGCDKEHDENDWHHFERN
jgi:hypothetical protein